MPTYRVTAPDGRTVKLTGDSPPTESELEDIFSKLPAPKGASPAAPPAGFERALAGAETIGPQPWYSKPNLGLPEHIAPLFNPLARAGVRGPSVTEILSALPAVGGAIGGMLGGAGGSAPGALAGAATGGAGGEAISQLGFRALGGRGPDTSVDAAVEIAKQGGTQAVLEGAGRLASAGTRALGRGMVENAVRPAPGLAAEFPDVVDTIIKERLPVGRGYFGSPKGSLQAAAKLKEESKAVKELLARATAGGKTFETSKIAAPVVELIDDIAEAEALNPGGMAQLDKYIANFLEKKKGPLSPTDVQKIKQQAQRIAEPIYKAVARGENVGTEQSIKAQFNAALATGAKQAMETVPGVAEGEARKRALIGAKKALSMAERRRLSLMAEGASGLAGAIGGSFAPSSGMPDQMKNAVLLWGFTRGILHPRQMSRVGLALTNEQAQALLRQFPRLAEWAAIEAPRAEE